MTPPWLDIQRGEAPLLVSLPHTGTDIPAAIAARLVSLDLARQDTDWWVDKLYDFAADLGATVTHTSISRTVIDVNRDPSGASLYPGQATTGLCPVTTFDGEPLYRAGEEPDEAEIAERRRNFFDPYHVALAAELQRLRHRHERIVLYDCHSIRSVVPRLFEGELPIFNLGTNGGASADPSLRESVTGHLAASGRSFVVDGRFRGGWITRAYGVPATGVHALQMELACRGYMLEPAVIAPDTWPSAYDPEVAVGVRQTLMTILQTARRWAAT
jgi:formiminoglutamase